MSISYVPPICLFVSLSLYFSWMLSFVLWLPVNHWKYVYLISAPFLFLVSNFLFASLLLLLLLSAVKFNLFHTFAYFSTISHRRWAINRRNNGKENRKNRWQKKKFIQLLKIIPVVGCRVSENNIRKDNFDSFVWTFKQQS